MSNWRIALQHFDSSGGGRCELFDEVGSQTPARIAVMACDPIADPAALTARAELANRLRVLGAKNLGHCSSGYPRTLDCQAFDEPACRHVLVLVIGSTPLDGRFDSLARDWSTRTGGEGIVLPALLPPLTHAAVFPVGAHPFLRNLTTSPWQGDVSRLVNGVLSASLLAERPGVFLSYLRSEASSAAEELHDGLARQGYRVFLDRFQGTSGRIFPHELAEAMSGMGLVCLFETASLRRSPWTLFEAAFARRFRIGPIAINFGGPAFPRAHARHTVPLGYASSLPLSARDAMVKFIDDHYLAVAVARRAYYESIVHLAARSRGHTVATDGRFLSISDTTGISVGTVLPSAGPGTLRHIRQIASQPPAGRIVASEHQHHHPADFADLRWLAQQHGIELPGSGSLYRAVVSLR